MTRRRNPEPPNAETNTRSGFGSIANAAHPIWSPLLVRVNGLAGPTLYLRAGSGRSHDRDAARARPRRPLAMYLFAHDESSPPGMQALGDDATMVLIMFVSQPVPFNDRRVRLLLRSRWDEAGSLYPE